MNNGTKQRRKNGSIPRSETIDPSERTTGPVFDPEAESGVLGSIAILSCQDIDGESYDAISTLVGMLSRDDFYQRRNQLIFEAISELYSERAPAIDAITIGDRLKVRGTFEEAGGAEYLVDVLESVPHAAHARFYAQIVRERSRQRQARMMMVSAAAELSEPNVEFSKTVEQLVENLTRIRGDVRSGNLPDLGFIDSKTFAGRTYESKWLVDFVLTAGEPCVVAGPSKTLKTTLLTELAVSLATGKDFLNRYRTHQHRVAFVSAESGEKTLQETANRVCLSKSIRFEDLETQLFWAFRPPQISEPDHIASLRDFIERNSVQVLMIDPAYLCMNLGEGATNQFTVGNILQNLTMLQSDTGVTPILAAHTNKNIAIGVELELSNIAYAGFDQWLRQYVLINRRDPYNRSEPGTHRLFMSFGGSAGHAGSLAIDIEEGDIKQGRKWEYSIQSAADAQAAAQNEKRAAAEQRRREAEQIAYEERRGKILGVMRRSPAGLTRMQARDQAGISGKCFPTIWQDLLDSQVIESAGMQKQPNNQNCEVFRVIEGRR